MSRYSSLITEPVGLGEVDPDVEFREADGVFVKVNSFSNRRPSKRDMHKHSHDHVSVVLGRFRLFLGDEAGIPDNAAYVSLGGPGEPHSVLIQANRYHSFLCLTPGGKVMCIHNGAHWDEDIKEMQRGTD